MSVWKRFFYLDELGAKVAFCTKCGRLLDEEDLFCPGCGKRAGVSQENPQKRESVWEGKRHKCPECGVSVPSFCEKCPTCGHEFRDVKAVNSVRELSERLDEIEAARVKEGEDKGKPRGEITATDEKKINLIRSFPIPNTKEDILEFLVLALSNYNVSFNEWGEDDSSASEKALRDAWKAKCDQAVEKCKIVFGDSPEAERAREMYEGKITKIERETKAAGKRQLLIWVAIMAFLLLLNVLLRVMNKI